MIHHPRLVYLIHPPTLGVFDTPPTLGVFVGAEVLALGDCDDYQVRNVSKRHMQVKLAH